MAAILQKIFSPLFLFFCIKTNVLSMIYVPKDPIKHVPAILPVASFIQEVNPQLAKCLLKTNGPLSNHE